jgi:hypothetical protein
VLVQFTTTDGAALGPMQEQVGGNLKQGTVILLQGQTAVVRRVQREVVRVTGKGMSMLSIVAVDPFTLPAFTFDKAENGNNV